ncbi:hypothetical protein [Streptomyces parvus]|uniref:Uncharacterized protein n=1 Tax=Streptomyces parvus TaxID=66428 RepID=A0A7K3RXT3_9ACTN|nr:hypothetical protein [Streptomyces parvus]NEC19969.1 hypothetical protein [Streptomyces parvus]
MDWFINSGASDAHVESHLGQGGVYCLLLDGRIAGLSILDGPTVDLMMIDPDEHGRGLLEDEGPAKLVYPWSATAS